MRAFRVGDGEDEIYTYDACIEFLCEKALEAFLEIGKGGEAAAKIFQEKVEKEVASLEAPEGENNNLFDQLSVKYGKQEIPEALNNLRLDVGNILVEWLKQPGQALNQLPKKNDKDKDLNKFIPDYKIEYNKFYKKTFVITEKNGVSRPYGSGPYGTFPWRFTSACALV